MLMALKTGVVSLGTTHFVPTIHRLKATHSHKPTFMYVSAKKNETTKILTLSFGIS